MELETQTKVWCSHCAKIYLISEPKHLQWLISHREIHLVFIDGEQ